MTRDTEPSAVHLSEFIYKIEEQGLNFYKQLMLKTNQYSTKFILQKVFVEHQKHMKNLQQDLADLGDEIINAAQFANVSFEENIKNYKEKYNPENLTFVEATKLAGCLVEKYIEIYENILNHKISSDWRKAIERMLENKRVYLQQLDNEHKRLRYNL